MKIISGSTSKKIGKDLCKELKCSLVDIEHKIFPDGEQYIRIDEDISNEEISIIQTTYPDEKIIELFLIQDAVKRFNVKKVHVVVPYFGYARQDQQFKKGEPISAEALAKIISLNADRVITIDPHKEYILDFFDVESFSCSAVSEIAKYLKGKDIDLVLAPDKGAAERAKKASNIIGTEFDFMEKKRLDGTTVEIKPKKINAKQKKVAIID
ncbi:MAG: ribose-phosphate diphosphokinase, partial [Candidatus Thermoplasmatota archaeon]